jgi:hypothetical protein
MSRKHFLIFARAISRINDAQQRALFARIIAECIVLCGATFNYAKFFKACNVV